METSEAWVAMPDGVRLAATLYMPDQIFPAERVPALLEYLPYRKDDALLERDHRLYSYMVARGYVGARVDIRGTGRSEGRLPDREYSEQEHRDALTVIDWLSQQPWCNGNVGMWGISWGGFNAIQVGMLAPPPLKAIIAVEASDDLFHLDIHYLDGILHIDEYELGIDVWNALSRAPDFPTDDISLHHRFDTDPWLLRWMREQRGGPFWQRGSLRPGYDRLRVPTMLVGGWYDGYRDSIPRMLEAVPAPTKAIVGPWNHTWPHSADPGPAIEWRREAVRWWDLWLKGRQTGMLEEPRTAVFVRDWHPPEVGLHRIPGRWRSEDWPIERTEPRTFGLRADRSLAGKGGSAAIHSLAYVPSVGAEAGTWWGELTVDQAPLDARCLAYDSSPLTEPLEILGFPVATLVASVDAPLAHFFVRICDVGPDGRATLVSGGGRNGSHLDSPERPRALEPGRLERVEVPLRFTSWVFPPGHRIRVAVSNALWPMMWPTPHPLTMSVSVGEGGSRIVLPVIPAVERPAPEFLEPEPFPSPPGVGSEGVLMPVTWDVEGDGPAARASWAGRAAAWFPWGRQVYRERLVFGTDDRHPAASWVSGDGEIRVLLEGRTVTWRSRLDLRSDETHFYYRYRRELEEDGRSARDRRWEAAIPRDGQ